MEKKVRNQLSGSDHHVHFDATERVEENNDIILKSVDENTIEVHVGFLKICHRYRISFAIPRSMLKIGANSSVLPVEDGPSTNCRIHSVLEDGDNDSIKFEIDYDTLSEKVTNEILKYRISDTGRVITLILTCRVIEKCKGTPLLRNGVHCSGVLPSDDEEDEEYDEPVKKTDK